MPYKGYVRKRPKHETTDSYFYLARQLAKCMLRADDLNFHIDPVGTEMNVRQHIPTSKICDSDNSKSKYIPADEKLSQVCSTDKSES